MELEQILRLDRCPFDGTATGEELGRRAEWAFCEEEVHFALFLRYMNRFMSQYGFHIPVPIWNSYVGQKNGVIFCNADAGGNFISGKRQVLTEFMQNVMVSCGWEIGSIRMERPEQYPKIFPAGAVSLQEWERIFSLMPGFKKLAKRGFRDVTVIICWNRGLYDYHEFCRNHESLIKEQFSEAAEAIEEILRKTSDPFALGLDETKSCFADQKYIMGFFEANHRDMAVSILDMDYNFLVQMLVLHMLVSRAEAQFGYRQKGSRMNRFEEAERIDTEPFDSELLEEIYVRPYAQEVFMDDVPATLLFRYFERFDQKYGTHVSRCVEKNSLIGEADMDDMVWYTNADALLTGAMKDSGWHIGAINTDEVADCLNNVDELLKDEVLFREAYARSMDDISADSFLKKTLIRESEIMREAVESMGPGILVISWNPQLNDYMNLREEHPDIVEAVCKKEDEWIMELEKDIWEPYMAFYRQEKDVVDGMAYCKTLLGSYGYSYVGFEAINPNWICKAVKLNKMLQLANERLACFRLGRKTKKAA